MSLRRAVSTRPLYRDRCRFSHAGGPVFGLARQQLPNRKCLPATPIQRANLRVAEIFSADSRQIYKLLNIGTAKPSKQQLEKISHHLIDILDLSENYDASLFEKDAEKVIEEILIKNQTPIVVGGSGLYIKALIDGIFDTADNDDEYRKQLIQKRKMFGNEYLYEELKKVDPESASRMLPQNWKRIMRALEVFHTTGEPIWKHHQKQSTSKTKKYNSKIKIFIKK